MSFDVQEVINQTYQSHTKETEEQDIGFLSIEECVVDSSDISKDIRQSDHESHDQQKNTASHGRGSLFVFVELSEYLGLFTRDRCFADGFSDLKFSEDMDVYRIEYPRDEKCNQRKHDDVVEFD